MKKLIWIFCFITMVMGMQSCDSNRIYEEYQSIPNYNWNMKQALRFEVEITDTIAANNLFLNVRNTGSYEYSNLWLFIKEIAPDGNVLEDKFECSLASDKGEWYGSGFGDIFDLQVPYKQNVIFRKPGVYVFEVVQGMREEDLKGIVDIGIRLEKANQ